MSWTTHFGITVPTNPEMVFLAVRRVADIPGEHPFRIWVDHLGDTRIWNEPGYFEGAVSVVHHDGEQTTADEDGFAPYVRVVFDSSYGVPDGPELHKGVTAELGAWCDEQGLPWWTSDERDMGRQPGWRERTPAFA